MPSPPHPDPLSRTGRPAWRPTASPEAIRLRAELLATTRAFFAERGVLEVETPSLAGAAATDPHLASMATRCGDRTLYLQTSPEYAMKRLLAAGSGPIYQLGRAFREGESGRRHNPEFTLLEWYRPGFDHHRLMDEVEELLEATLGLDQRPGGRLPAERLTYREAFRRHVGIDPLTDPLERLVAAALDLAGPSAGGGRGALPDLGDDRDGWLDLLMVTAVQEHLGRDEGRDEGPGKGRGRVTFLHDYPASQAALAKVRRDADGTAVAERFEVFVEGVELANGFHELTDAAEQRRRFEHDLEIRRSRGLPEVPIDERLLAALDEGMPECAGVALGFDRLVMLAAGAASIAEVIAFPIDRA